jgi:hypothetical protein
MSPPPLKAKEPSAGCVAVRAAVLDALTREAAAHDLSAMEVLAVLAYTTGQAVAAMDRRTFTPEMAMAVVAQNLEAGNRDAVDTMLGPQARGRA